ncbi:hypothetical protein NX862_13365 [Rhodobacter sp. KR11]|uniref:hypothetical protein n=1 Tax=Rhodobacter sp. KR11 TaxID=2974588 RepID=UPI002222D44F|nr:hypothetical protein [Rhodobacter sp. KR11]MCW1919746.1 hypothetical protein [Rhodobacter sp. KR11]
MRANLNPFSGPAELIFGFKAVIIGGMGSFWGTLAGGILLGVAQAFGAAISPQAQVQAQVLTGHLVLFAVLALRPRGLFRMQGASFPIGT